MIKKSSKSDVSIHTHTQKINFTKKQNKKQPQDKLIRKINVL